MAKVKTFCSYCLKTKEFIEERDCRGQFSIFGFSINNNYYIGKCAECSKDKEKEIIVKSAKKS